MGSNVNKQYIKLLDKPVLVHTLQVFEKSNRIHEIVLVVQESERAYCQKEIVEAWKLKKVSQVVSGGRERQESVWKGVDAVSSDCDIVVVHDGARPFVTVRNIEDSIVTAELYGAVGVGVPVKDTIKMVDTNQMIKQTPDRKELWAIHTPQTFDRILLKKAHQKAAQEGFIGTDDTVLVERLGISVKMIEGSYENIKITTPEDLYFGEAILRKRMEMGE
ncbi:MAG: 2-C-methyl-D-erythritol 4-phosphate cytidylyltransferase [Bacillota bacterium]